MWQHSNPQTFPASEPYRLPPTIGHWHLTMMALQSIIHCSFSLKFFPCSISFIGSFPNRGGLSHALHSLPHLVHAEHTVGHTWYKCQLKWLKPNRKALLMLLLKFRLLNVIHNHGSPQTWKNYLFKKIPSNRSYSLMKMCTVDLLISQCNFELTTKRHQV